MTDFLQKHKTLCVVALALAATAAFTTVLPGTVSRVHALVYCALFAASSFYFLWRALRVLDTRMAAFAGLGGLLLAFALAVGADVYEDLHMALSIINLARIALVTACLAPPVAAGLACLFDAVPRLAARRRVGCFDPADWGRAKLFFVVWGALILFWLPAYLGYFPGIWGYDMGNQAHQATTGNYSAYQPLLHTLLYRLCHGVGMAAFGQATAGVAIFTAVQALILSACLAHVTTFLALRLRVPAWLWLLAAAFYALAPFHAILAVSSTKDTVFAGVFLVLLTQACALCMDPEAFVGSVREVVAFVLCAIAACLLRNNMLYAFLFGAVFLVAGIAKKRARVALLAVVTAVCAFGCGRLLSVALGASDGPRSELLNVPIQQVACAYERHADALSEQDKREVDRYLPEERLKQYYPLLSDPVKLDSNIGHGLPSILGFLKVWAHWLPTYFNDYTDSFLTMTLGYWLPGETFHARIYDGYNEPDTEETLGYMYTGFMEQIDPAVQKRSLWPGAERYYQWFAHQRGHERIPLFSLLFTPGTYCWALFIALVTLLYFKRYALCLPLALPYGVWLTLLLGPCVLVRYAYPIMAGAPLFAGLVFNQTERHTLIRPMPDEHAGSDGRGAEMLRFAVAGGVGFVIDYGCTYAFTALAGMHYLLATALAFLLSVVVNYLMCAYWVFRGADTKDRGVKAGFLITSVIGLGLNELFMYLFVGLLRLHVMLAKLVAVVLVMIWNYISKRKVLVKQPKKTER